MQKRTEVLGFVSASVAMLGVGGWLGHKAINDHEAAQPHSVTRHMPASHIVGQMCVKQSGNLKPKCKPGYDVKVGQVTDTVAYGHNKPLDAQAASEGDIAVPLVIGGLLSAFGALVIAGRPEEISTVSQIPDIENISR